MAIPLELLNLVREYAMPEIERPISVADLNRVYVTCGLTKNSFWSIWNQLVCNTMKCTSTKGKNAITLKFYNDDWWEFFHNEEEYLHMPYGTTLLHKNFTSDIRDILTAKGFAVAMHDKCGDVDEHISVSWKWVQ